MKVLKNLLKNLETLQKKILESNLQVAGIPRESIDVQSAEGHNVVAKYGLKKMIDSCTG